MLVGVELHQSEHPPGLGRHLLEGRGEHLARSAPVGVHVEKYGDGRFDHEGLDLILLGDFEDDVLLLGRLGGAAAPALRSGGALAGSSSGARTHQTLEPRRRRRSPRGGGRRRRRIESRRHVDRLHLALRLLLGLSILLGLDPPPFLLDLRLVLRPLPPFLLLVLLVGDQNGAGVVDVHVGEGEGSTGQVRIVTLRGEEFRLRATTHR
mmetsp:Transcript_25259/g.74273  ORF Transcript_25259/g.74273 Transcript_25259/m.74273 type:complete len:208 (+) Transcript_25259:1309-1932(+)